MLMKSAILCKHRFVDLFRRADNVLCHVNDVTVQGLHKVVKDVRSSYSLTCDNAEEIGNCFQSGDELINRLGNVIIFWM